MDLSSEGNMKARFQKLGRALKYLPPSKDELLKILEEATSCLKTIEQDDYGSMFLARDSLFMQLARHELLDHENGEVRIMVIFYISEVIRITTPKLPYCDVIMEDIFEVMVGSFQGL
ncbi:hypothetical protein KI387_001511 [Taxus chinensis]|uniref:Uncharacterized protein n=1 Tax=Taxus chinensis TaxID=29808 RepID=A0AA38LLK1_TAXCH|nr:hypothetical protein KI387_001511 [Taxus chinensis]